MRPLIPHPVKICLGTGMAALTLGLLNSYEYAQQLEISYPKTAQHIREIASRTGLPDFHERTSYSLERLSEALFQFSDTLTGKNIPEQQLAQPTYIEIDPAPRKLLDKRVQRIQEAPTDFISIADITIPQDFAAIALKPTLEPAQQEEVVATTTPEETPATVESTPEPETIAAEQTPATPEYNAENPVHYRVMLMGDSLMEALGPHTFEEMRNRKGLHFILTSKFSTGFARPDYFDWPQNLKIALKNTKPDVVLFFIGANDGQPIEYQGKSVYPKTPDVWSLAYKEKLQEIVDIIKEHHCDIIWLGLPPMGKSFTKKMKLAETSQQEICEANHITYLDTTYILGDEKGEYQTFGTNAKGKSVRLRHKDCVHISTEGLKLLFDYFSPILEQRIADFRQKNPDKRLTATETKSITFARMERVIKYPPKNRQRRR